MSQEVIERASKITPLSIAPCKKLETKVGVFMDEMARDPTAAFESLVRKLDAVLINEVTQALDKKAATTEDRARNAAIPLFGAEAKKVHDIMTTCEGMIGTVESAIVYAIRACEYNVAGIKNVVTMVKNQQIGAASASTAQVLSTT